MGMEMPAWSVEKRESALRTSFILATRFDILSFDFGQDDEKGIKETINQVDDLIKAERAGRTERGPGKRAQTVQEDARCTRELHWNAQFRQAGSFREQSQYPSYHRQL